jgi:hypothetical protein
LPYSNDAINISTTLVNIFNSAIAVIGAFSSYYVKNVKENEKIFYLFFSLEVVFIFFF